MLRLQEHVHTHTNDTDKHKQLPEIASTLLYTFLHRGRNTNVDLLPELSDSAGQVGGICQTVVGKTFLCVPGVVTALPR